ncbi:hypothetical protein HJG60_011061 [Phyllostomus discolor]|uniref:Uncharacterized protein n=1 Tax=Phyllostomus discolor TaxID=89673 RepID=A0A834E6R2_9CHIR|nr:hypothetical protein HJG60_011061 [Phyllostomus discolor]
MPCVLTVCRLPISAFSTRSTCRAFSTPLFQQNFSDRAAHACTHPLSSSLLPFPGTTFPSGFCLCCSMIKVTDAFHVAKPRTACPKPSFLTSHHHPSLLGTSILCLPASSHTYFSGHSAHPPLLVPLGTWKKQPCLDSGSHPGPRLG